MAMTHRRGALVLAAAALAACLAARASMANEAVARFIEPAHATALFQHRISAAAAARDIRPEAKDLAVRMTAFRAAQLPELAKLARDAGLPVRQTLDLELRTIAENLEPLEYLAMARRYLEVEIEALGLEIAAYREVARAGPDPVKAYAKGALPRLEEFAASARDVMAVVRP